MDQDNNGLIDEDDLRKIYQMTGERIGFVNVPGYPPNRNNRFPKSNTAVIFGHVKSKQCT